MSRRLVASTKAKPESELSVLVTVLPVDAPEPEELPPTTVFRSKPLSPESIADPLSSNNNSNSNHSCSPGLNNTKQRLRDDRVCIGSFR